MTLTTEFKAMLTNHISGGLSERERKFRVNHLIKVYRIEDPADIKEIFEIMKGGTK